MKTVRSIASLEAALKPLRSKKSIGFVPTMGALHEGHLSLVRLAKKQNDVVVASIFVNPTQFGPKEDFKKYPRNLSKDAALLKSAKADILFYPSAAEMYPEGFQTSVTVSELAKPLCGLSRPWHFGGVATVVAKLLGAVKPDTLYLGQKDYQQFLVVERMARDLNLTVHVKMAPIVREKDGLAMSSRNAYLSVTERKEATALNRALLSAKKLLSKGERNAAALKTAMRREIAATSGRIDYAEIVDARTLADVLVLKKGSKALFALAVRFGKTRLIDNILVNP
jgi:pantoate--beta-alanine ligase